MANPEHVKIVRRGGKAFCNWRKENSDVRLDLSGADLRNVRLCNADFSGAELGEASLRRLNIYSAELRAAIVGNANLLGADLSKADLRGAKLNRADLREASSAAVSRRSNPTNPGGAGRSVAMPAEPGQAVSLVILKDVDFVAHAVRRTSQIVDFARLARRIGRPQQIEDRLPACAC